MDKTDVLVDMQLCTSCTFDTQQSYLAAHPLADTGAHSKRNGFGHWSRLIKLMEGHNRVLPAWQLLQQLKTLHPEFQHDATLAAAARVSFVDTDSCIACVMWCPGCVLVKRLPLPSMQAPSMTAAAPHMMAH